MKLPGADGAIVDGAKVRDYLLSPEHPVGRFKAVFFGALGYKRDQWQRLQQDLVDLGRSGTAEEGQKTRFGQKYEVRCRFSPPFPPACSQGFPPGLGAA